MNILINLSFIMVSMLAVSYGWGMRGTTIGGEKGAMLPGALIGTIIAIFSGVYIVQENFFVFASLGAIGMYFGGCMTYGETLSFSMSAKPAVNMKKGIFALALKGFLWFSVFGGIFATGFCAVCGIYKWYELLIIFALTPVLSVAGLLIFNRPINVNEVKYPKHYFSKTRKEYWGAMLGMTVSLVIINIFTLNAYPVIFTVLCGIFGALGFSIGQLVQIYFKHYAIKSKVAFIKKIGSLKILDTWKAMECTFGAIGGAGLAISFIITKAMFKKIAFNLELSGGIVPLHKTLTTVLFFMWLVLIALDTFHYFVKKPLNTLQLKNLKEQGKIADADYFNLIFKSRADSTEIFKKTQWYFEVYEFIVYAAIPFVLICLGSEIAANVIAVFLMYWVLVQEIAFEDKNKERMICFSVLGVVFLIVQIIFKAEFNSLITFVLYTVFYEVATLAYLLPEIIAKSAKQTGSDYNYSKKEKARLVLNNKGFVITHTYFIAVIIILLFNI